LIVLNYGDKKVMSKFQIYFDAEQAALLAVGLYQQFHTMEDLNKAADDNDVNKEICRDAKKLTLLLQSNIDDHERNGVGYPTSFSVCPDSGSGVYTKDQLKAFVKPMNVDGLIENIGKQYSISVEKPLGVNEKKTLLRIIGALTNALADQGPQNLSKEGSPIVGTDESGIIGFLKKNSYISVGKSTLHKHISYGLSEIEDYKKQ
tara:strand:- start:411 stop:1022 length:612 start_codon:yes stop_codon:yes gene_type:complete